MNNVSDRELSRIQYNAKIPAELIIPVHDCYYSVEVGVETDSDL